MHFFKRGVDTISRIKMIIGMMVCLLTVITGTVNQIEPNVSLDVASEVTTQSTEINFVLENKGSATLRQGIWLKSFEKKVDGQWKEIPFHESINSEDTVFKTNPVALYFFPNETVECKFRTDWLLSDDGGNLTTLDAGEYRITFSFQTGVRTFKEEPEKYGLASCEFEVKEA